MKGSEADYRNTATESNGLESRDDGAHFSRLERLKREDDKKERADELKESGLQLFE